MLTKLSKQLRDFGLSENEVSVYIALLQDGSDTAANIAKKAKLNRSTTYVQLDTLMNYGLASTFKKGKKTFFSPESPHNVKRLITAKIEELEQERDNIESILPGLDQLYTSTGGAPDVKTFEGAEGLKTMREAIIESNVDAFYMLYNADQLYEIYEPDELLNFSQRRAKKGIYGNGLYNKKGKPFQKVYNQKMLQLDRKKFPIDADIYVYGDYVSLASTAGKIVGITIHNKQIAESMRTLFKLGMETKNYLNLKVKDGISDK